MKPVTGRGNIGAVAAHFLTSIYVGYYGGGAGFMVLAALTMASMAVQPGQLWYRMAPERRHVHIGRADLSILSHGIAFLQALMIFYLSSTTKKCNGNVSFRSTIAIMLNRETINNSINNVGVAVRAGCIRKITSNYGAIALFDATRQQSPIYPYHHPDETKL